MVDPVIVEYCDKCKVPFEYCEFFGHGSVAPDDSAKSDPVGDAASALADASLAGSEGEVKSAKQEKKTKPNRITIVVAARNKKKSLTSIYGLELFGRKLDDAAKTLKKRFACGAAAIKDAQQRECVQLQGNLEYDLPEYLAEWLEIDEDLIEVEEK